MTDRAERLLEELLELSRPEQVEVFDRLGASLAPVDVPVISRAWRDEIRDRIARIDAGASDLVDLDEVERELWAEQDADELTAGTPGR